jgi:hypothetical protein
MVNTADTKKVSGTTCVSYLGGYTTDGYDFTTEAPVITVVFDVLKAGSWSVNNNWLIMTARNEDDPLDEGIPYFDNGVEYKKGSVTNGVVSADPVNIKTTVNGIEYNVGDTVTYTYSMKVDSTVQDYQGNVTYDNAGLKYVAGSMQLGDSVGVYYNDSTVEGEGMFDDNGNHYLSYNGINISGYDYSSLRTLVTAQFTVTQAGTWTISNNLVRMDDLNDVSYVKKGEVLKAFTSSEATTLSSGSQATTSSSTTASNNSKTATVNGTEYAVGSVVKYAYYVQIRPHHSCGR